MNWGHYITIAFILFATFILYMVVRAFNVNIDLVTEDYYAREMAYENKMIQKANFEALGAEISLKQTEGGIEISYPEKIVAPKGEVYFYHPSEESYDKTYAMNLSADRTQIIPRKELIAGRYRVNFTWESEGKEYFQQASLFIR